MKPAKHSNRHHHFFAAWIRSPLKMGALVPSSRGLARAMASHVNIAKPGTVIELGAGTGVVTHALVQTHIAYERLLIIERDVRLHTVMATQFPHLNVVCADAMQLDAVLQEHNVSAINAIVSSLPLLSMPEPVRNGIVHQMATLIGEAGNIVQFTYGPRSPISRHHMRKYHLSGKRVKLVMANIPPAHVWVYHRAHNTK